MMQRLFKREPAAPEDSWALRRILMIGQIASVLFLAWTGGIGLWVFGAAAIAGIYFAHQYAHRARHAPSKRVRLIIFIALHLAVCWMMFGLAVGLPYPQAQMAMLGMTLADWEVFSRRQMMTGWLLGGANLYVAAILSRTPLFLLFLLVYVGLFLWFLHRAESNDALQAEGVLVGQPERSPAERPRYISILPLSALRIGLFVIAVGTLIFFLLPRLVGTPLIPPITLRVPIQGGPKGQIVNPALPVVQVQGWSSDSSDYYHGFDSRLDLSYRGGLNPTIMMYVRSPAKSYWRSHAYDEYDGRTWIQSNPENVTLMSRPVTELSYVLDDNPPAGEPFLQTFYIQQSLPNLAFVGGQPVELYLAAEQIAIDETGGIRLGETLEQGMTYSVLSISSRFEPQELRAAGRDYPPEILEQYLQLPETITDRTRQLAHELTADFENPYDKAIAIQNHLLSAYPYDFFPPPQAPNTDAVDQFLFVDQTGFCEHYVSAMVVMLRSLGIPARLTAGYGSGQFDPLSNLYTVRALDAHAWVEVYFPEYGWIPFEPTPGWEGDVQTGRVRRSTLANFGRSLDLPAIPFGALAEGAAAVGGILMMPLLIIGAILLTGGLGWWGWRRYQGWRYSQHHGYTATSAGDAARRRILAEYRRMQRVYRAWRRPAQTPAEHAAEDARFEEIRERVEEAAYRPES